MGAVAAGSDLVGTGSVDVKLVPSAVESPPPHDASATAAPKPSAAATNNLAAMVTT
jgi:hypothetical protein